MSQRVDIAKYLLAEGADINAKFEPHGDSSFELAERSTSKGGQEVYQLLKVVYEKQLEKKRVRIFWPDDDAWYSGVITSYSSRRGAWPASRICSAVTSSRCQNSRRRGATKSKNHSTN